jgi:hypothetical protein
LLELVGHVQQFRLGEVVADDLQADRALGVLLTFSETAG